MDLTRWTQLMPLTARAMAIEHKNVTQGKGRQLRCIFIAPLIFASGEGSEGLSSRGLEVKELMT